MDSSLPISEVIRHRFSITSEQSKDFDTFKDNYSQASDSFTLFAIVDELTVNFFYLKLTFEDPNVVS